MRSTRTKTIVMRNYRVASGIAACSLAFALAAPVADAEEVLCKKLVGTFATTPVLDCPDSPIGVCTKGKLDGDLQGEYLYAFRTLAMSMDESGKRAFTAFSVITIGDGLLRTEDAGMLDSGAMMDATPYVSTGTATEATGVFAGNRVTFVVRGGLSVAGTMGTYEATLCGESPRG
jgi:hypothetical protein